MYAIRSYYERLRGVYSPEHYRRECQLLRGFVEKQRGAHWTEFLERWVDRNNFV